MPFSQSGLIRHGFEGCGFPGLDWIFIVRSESYEALRQTNGILGNPVIEFMIWAIVRLKQLYG